MATGIYKRTKPIWNKGLPKEKQPRFGKRHTNETKIRISNSEMGKIVSMKTRKKIGNAYVKTQKRMKQITELGKSKKGKNNPNWKGGVSKLKVYKHYRNKEYLEWRKIVFERDNYTCQICANRSSRGNPVVIHPHHIKSYTNYLELRYDADNGITLCISCHHQVHWGH